MIWEMPDFWFPTDASSYLRQFHHNVAPCDLLHGDSLKFLPNYSILLLMLELQPSMGFSLHGDFLPFRPFLVAQFSPPSYSHCLDIFLNVFNPSFPWSTYDSPTHWLPFYILLDILPPSIRITCPSRAILMLFINLTVSAFPISSFSSRFFLILQFPFSSCTGPKKFP